MKKGAKNDNRGATRVTKKSGSAQDIENEGNKKRRELRKKFYATQYPNIQDFPALKTLNDNFNKTEK